MSVANNHIAPTFCPTSLIPNIATGSLTKRLGIPEGTILEKPLLEYCFKKDELNDPVISKEHIYNFGWATEDEINTIDKMTLRINDLLLGLFRGVGIKLVDFKIEYGKTWNKDTEQKEIILADEKQWAWSTSLCVPC